MMLEELHFNTLIAIQSYEYYENIFLSKSYWLSKMDYFHCIGC